MNRPSADLAQVTQVLEELRAEVARLGSRIDALETVGAKSASSGQQTASASSAVNAAPQPAISEEVVLVISAAIAAFLGKKPHIRQIRLIGTGAWSQQGRVGIQTSHAIEVPHDRF